jgi:hypothetical protein
LRRATAPAPEPLPPPADQTDIDDIYASLEVLQHAGRGYATDPGAQRCEHAERSDTIDSIKTQVEESLQKALARSSKRRREPDEAEVDMTDAITDYDVAEAMLTYGGSFAQALALCWQKADVRNQRRLQEAFPEVWAEYQTLAELQWRRRLETPSTAD